MGRMVDVDTGYQTVLVAQDLLEILLGSSQAALVHSIKVYQSSDFLASEAELLQVTAKRAYGSYTSGSVGGTPTVFKYNKDDAAHGMTVKRNNTTQAVAGTGTLEDIPHLSDVLNVISGTLEITPTPELRQPLGPSQALILSVPAPIDALTMRAVVSLEILVG